MDSDSLPAGEARAGGGRPDGPDVNKDRLVRQAALEHLWSIFGASFAVLLC